MRNGLLGRCRGFFHRLSDLSNSTDTFNIRKYLLLHLVIVTGETPKTACLLDRVSH